MTTHETLDSHIYEAEQKALDSLAKYKFQMFGYWAAIWVHLNRIEGKKRPNPFAALVKQARNMKAGQPDLLNDPPDLEAWLLKQMKTSTAGYLAALEDTLQKVCNDNGSDTWKNYLEDQQ